MMWRLSYHTATAITHTQDMVLLLLSNDIMSVIGISGSGIDLHITAMHSFCHPAWSLPSTLLSSLPPPLPLPPTPSLSLSLLLPIRCSH